jgi:fatty-acyl-CoA synthase
MFGCGQSANFLWREKAILTTGGNGFLLGLPSRSATAADVFLQEPAFCKIILFSMIDSATFPPNTVPAMLQQRTAYTANALAFCFPEHGQAYSWAQLWHETRQLAAGLLQRGVGPGARVAVLMEGRVELVLALLAVVSIGGVVVPLNPFSTRDELRSYCRDAQPVALLLGAATRLGPADLAPDQTSDWLPRQVFVLAADAPAAAPFRPFAELLTAGPDQAAPDFEAAARATTAADPSFLLYTSGTTGEPKGVLRTTASFLGLAVGKKTGKKKGWLARQTDRFTNRFAVLSLLPLYHLGGIGTLFTALKLANVRTVLLARFHPVVALQVAAREHCRFLIGTPYMLQAMMAAQPAQRVRLEAVLGVVFASAAVNGAILERVLRELPRVQFFTVSYGSSEAGAVANGTCLVSKKTSLGMSLFLRLLRGAGVLNGLLPFEVFGQTPYSICGRIDKAVEVATIDLQTGALLPPGAPGEIVIRSHRVMRYARAQAEGSANFRPDGWYRSGDVGYVDPRGWLVLTDRLKRLISRGGEKISPAEIEDVLLRQPGVADACVVGVPDELYGEQVGAAVVPEPGATLDTAALRAALGTHLARFKVPTHWLLLPELPVSATGKVASTEVRQLVLQHIAQPSTHHA